MDPSSHPRASLPHLLGTIEALINCESPSADAAAVARSADLVARIGTALLGRAPRRIDGIHLLWRLGDRPGRVLVLGHHDTVWPVGSLATHPYEVRDGVLRGAGCFDMKAGVAMAFHALAVLGEPGGITLLITGDEEIGSPGSRGVIEAEAAGCAAALVLEGAAGGGALKTARKGLGRYVVRALGRAAHAGLAPGHGVNTTVELAHQILRTDALADPARGTTVTPTLLTSGASANTVPADGEFAVDVRASDPAELARVDGALRGLQPVLGGARLEITGGPDRPPLPWSASAGLYDRACRTARRLGLAVPAAAAVGGGSDGNLTAAAGTPTLDGLGAVGGGAHGPDEHVLIDLLPERTALLTALTADLLADPCDGTNSGATIGVPRP
ncbi:M20/M25/M40 family metallo-hydrolase [Catenuloplanes atrovinosus]|uniref:Glutamate carboxypeptidase n=1 Tax=Catenuloplanes atrovinosus TaxID=137266 RepID=A0AAE4CAQ3_9ACTN|nr:M20/M25/M40 family metallo-hydrolase [Catenuloplanes atrovinosus]MDR7277272.1 glutamate carboxypeptidase [Catenuloplanes atrovinosus]